MRSKLMVMTATALACMIAPASAQTVDELVEKHVEARGGYDRIKAVQTIKITRTVATQFSNVKVVLYKKRPSLLRVEQTAPGQPTIPRWVNAEGAWDLIQGKVVARTAAAAAELRDIDADFDGLLVDWKQKGHTVTLEGKEALAGGDAYKLKVVTRSGATRYVFLDGSTYLERRHTGQMLLPNNRRENSTIDFSNYKRVDGILFPFNIDEDRSGPQITQSFATYTEKIELNVPMEDSLFATPPPSGPPLSARR